MSDFLKQNKLEFSSRALFDLEEIWVHISDDSEETANKILKQITGKCNQLLSFSKIGKERNDLIVGLRSFPVGKFIIFYQENDFGIEIVRVLHSSRDIEQIFDEMIPLEP